MSDTQPVVRIPGTAPGEGPFLGPPQPAGSIAENTVAPKAVNAWNLVQDAVNITLRERLSQSQTHRSNAWRNLSRV